MSGEIKLKVLSLDFRKLIFDLYKYLLSVSQLLL